MTPNLSFYWEREREISARIMKKNGMMTKKKRDWSLSCDHGLDYAS